MTAFWGVCEVKVVPNDNTAASATMPSGFLRFVAGNIRITVPMPNAMADPNLSDKSRMSRNRPKVGERYYSPRGTELERRNCVSDGAETKRETRIESRLGPFALCENESKLPLLHTRPRATARIGPTPHPSRRTWDPAVYGTTRRGDYAFEPPRQEPWQFVGSASGRSREPGGGSPGPSSTFRKAGERCRVSCSGLRTHLWRVHCYCRRAMWRFCRRLPLHPSIPVQGGFLRRMFLSSMALRPIQPRV